ncbi:MAG: hypothetical protein LBV69_00770 [Bacteroidales bacterium]|jgi:lysozyme|nr:hypothetical protein [Bacteroidales bacterium]
MTKKKRKVKKSNKKSIIITIIIVVFVIGILLKLYYPFFSSYFFKSNENLKSIDEFKIELPEYSTFGIDVSTYQDDIQWDTVFKYQKIDFVFIRATAGNNNFDKRFVKNWSILSKKNIIKGAYHYFRPDESSEKQANFFIKNVKLETGDLPPILDIEALSKVKNLNDLKSELLNWLNIVEKYYKITPILYSYNNYYSYFLTTDKRFQKYPLWIAWYNTKERPNKIAEDWVFWQFSDKGKIIGIKENVDVNVFNGSLKDLDGLRIKK